MKSLNHLSRARRLLLQPPLYHLHPSRCYSSSTTRRLQSSPSPEAQKDVTSEPKSIIPNRPPPGTNTSTLDLLESNYLDSLLRAPKAAPTSDQQRWRAGTSTATRHDFLSLIPDPSLNPNLPPRSVPAGSFSADPGYKPASEWDSTVKAADRNLHLGPRVGRMVRVNGQKEGEVQQKLKALSMIVLGNKIPQTVGRQRFHERPGLKRKRLRKERWRKRFKETFKGICERVKFLGKQGW